MLLYNLTFPTPGVCAENELYFRGGELRVGRVCLKDGESVTFDTYYNAFSHIKYKKYTDIKRVTCKLETDGAGIARILRYVKDGQPEILAEKEIAGCGALCADVSSIEDKGFLYAQFTARGDCEVVSGGWHADIGRARPVKIGIVICTYKREQYLRRNIENLRKYMNDIEHKFFDVYIVDNAKTIDADFGDGIKVIPNSNTGGSGGFTRGIKEVLKGDYTHFLLMDDDILFDARILGRTASLLSALKEEYKSASVGGAMLILDKPHMQKEQGGDWTGYVTAPRRHLLDARKADTICGNEEDKEPNYNSWFYMCMPTDTPNKYGYPLPFFIRCDDVEYSLRAAEHIIVTSGIAVWHEDFGNKYSPEMEYYIRRNELILCSRYPFGKGFFANWKKLALGVGKTIALQRYFAADLRFKAYDDFLKGPEYFLNLDAEANHNSLKKYCPEFLTESEIQDRYGISVNPDCNPIHKKFGLKNLITLNGYLIPKCFYKKGIAQIDIRDYSVGDFYKQRQVLQFNALTGKSFVTEIKKSAIFKYGFKLIGYFFKLLFRYRLTAKKFAAIDVKSL